MQNLFFERLMLIMSHLKVDSLRGFASRIGITYSKLQSYQRGSSPSIDVLNIILSKVDNLSGEWLVTGRGEMFRDVSIPTEGKTAYSERDIEQSIVEDRLTSLEYKQILKDEITWLKAELKDRNKQVSDLTKMNLYLLEREKGGGHSLPEGAKEGRSVG